MNRGNSQCDLQKYCPEQQRHLNEILANLKEEFKKKYSDKSTEKNVTSDDFERLRTIGTGSYGRVYLVRNKYNGSLHAMKAIEKQIAVEADNVENILLEKKVLKSISFPFVTSLEYAIKDNVYIYFILPLAQGGEMFMHLRRAGAFSEDLTKFYASQIVLALEYLHFCGVIYRDLKPENVLIEKSGYIKLTDFGFSRILQHRTYTLCGTPEYLAPEIINASGYGFPVDWWALGILIYEMSVGNPPFIEADHMKLYEMIVSGKFKFSDKVRNDCRMLLKGLIQVDPSKRLGSSKSDIYEIKNHKYFSSIYWMSVLHKKMAPPFIPSFEDDECKFYMTVPEIVPKAATKCLYKEEFADF